MINKEESLLHHPPHIYQDNTWYMITASIYESQRILRPGEHKGFFRDQLEVYTRTFEIRLAAWVILDDHYHILIKIRAGSNLTGFIRKLHGRVAYELNKNDSTPGRKVWHNYWDTCIRSEVDYWKRFNYIHYNPVKHGYVNGFEQWEYSSYSYYLDKYGADWVANIFREYPIVEFADLKEQF